MTCRWVVSVGDRFSFFREYCINVILPSPSLCFRSGKRIKKTRKYDIITTPAERVEMAPLNEEDDEDEDSTVFDVKYRYCCELVQLGLLTELLLGQTALSSLLGLLDRDEAVTVSLSLCPNLTTLLHSSSA